MDISGILDIGEVLGDVFELFGKILTSKAFWKGVFVILALIAFVVVCNRVF
jgi:hypothetical protein